MQPEPPILFDINDVVCDLIRKKGIHEGLYDLSVEFNIAVGSFGTQPNHAVLPGTLVTVSRVGIQRTSQRNANTVDAAEVNPRKKGQT